MSADSTSILDLPMDPLGGTNAGNISLSASQSTQIVTENPMQPSGMTLDQTTINQIVSGLQQASVSGATQLPSRDIPMQTVHHSTDPQTQPNYLPSIPTRQQSDYIRSFEESNDIVNQYKRNADRDEVIDDAYNEIQTPLLLAILYFLFQLPFFRRFLFQYIPFLFSEDGNLNLNGFLFTSTLFGLLYYVLNKVSHQFHIF